MKLLVAVDGSEPAARAIDAVAQLARAGAALQLVLLNVQEGPVYYGELPPTAIEQVEAAQRRHQDQVLAAAEARARAAGLTVAGLQRSSGLASAAILRAAADGGADQIVMGTRGMGALGNLLLGSVAQQVLHAATVPVLLVR